jgi:hypothetical protein
LRVLQAEKRADERTRTADLISLRVIIHVLLGFAQDCETRISKPILFSALPCIATYCAPSGVRVVSIHLRIRLTLLYRFRSLESGSDKL